MFSWKWIDLQLKKQRKHLTDFVYSVYFLIKILNNLQGCVAHVVWNDTIAISWGNVFAAV